MKKQAVHDKRVKNRAGEEEMSTVGEGKSEQKQQQDRRKRVLWDGDKTGRLQEKGRGIEGDGIGLLKHLTPDCWLLC